MDTEMKYCKKCDTTKKLDCFYKSRTTGKPTTYCKACSLKWSRESRAKNRKRYNAYQRWYYQSTDERNEKYRALVTKWQAEHKEEADVYRKKYREENRELIRAKQNKRNKDKRKKNNENV